MGEDQDVADDEQNEVDDDEHIRDLADSGRDILFLLLLAADEEWR